MYIHLMDERERDFIAYKYLCRLIYYPRVQKPCMLEKACVMKRTFI